MAGRFPARGQVWRSDRVFSDGESADFLVISCDDWNQRRVHNVLGLEIAPGHDNESARFAPLIMVGDQPMTVYGDVILAVPKDGLVDSDIELDAKAMAEVDQVLDLALTPAAALPGPVAPRPAKHPRTGQIRFADLHIEGEPDKPVVVVSSEIYGADLAFEFVLACRVTSNPLNPHDFDVVLTSQTGKVVCSDLRTVASVDLRERTTRGAVAVSARERDEILAKVRRMVGIA